MAEQALPRVVAVVGTTASGKSDQAIRLALALGHAEIVSADSRQVYRGLDVGAGKVTPAERRLVPHHLLDVASLHGPRFTVADYQRLALAAIEDIRARGRLPILVGGTGLYVQAVVDNPAYPAPADPALRAELERTPLDALVARLRQLDPRAAATLDLRNPRRVLRAVEATLSAGIPFSRQRVSGPPRVHALQLGITWPREELRRRIAARVQARLVPGHDMLDEVRGLLRSGVPAARLLELGLEYRFVTRHLLGELGYAEMVAALEVAIHQFSRRQLTWFRRDPRIHWLAADANPLNQAHALATAFVARD